MDLEKISYYVENSPMILEQLMAEYGIGVLMVTQFISGAGLLYVIPDVAVAPTYTLSSASGILDLPIIILASATSLMAGNILFYWFFRLIGDRLISDQRRQNRTWRLMAWLFNKHPKFALIAFRCLPIGSELIAIPAGLTKIKMRKFIKYSYIGYVLSQVIFVSATWLIVEQGLLNSYIEQLNQQYQFMQYIK